MSKSDGWTPEAAREVQDRNDPTQGGTEHLAPGHCVMSLGVI